MEDFFLRPSSHLMRLLALLLALCVAPAASLTISGSASAVRPGGRSLRFVRMEDAPPPPPSGRLGATVDQDGKSNVWAVEPAMKVDSQNKDKGLIAYAPVIGVAGLIVLLVPLLPILFAANPDQATAARITIAQSGMANIWHSPRQ
mmetsp:Transcript_38076/g.119543  ORF Transcript_38076/g.119543 Transcript_38076/m.119543 type:complete len:146 (-) Transcript_38076:59-496(-)